MLIDCPTMSNQLQSSWLAQALVINPRWTVFEPIRHSHKEGIKQMKRLITGLSLALAVALGPTAHAEKVNGTVNSG